MGTKANSGICSSHIMERCYHDCPCENQDPECDNIPRCIFCKELVK